MAAGFATGMVVKNTFLEVGNHQPLMEMSDWRRQMSDPGASFPRQISDVTTSEGDPGDPVKIYTKESSENADTSQGDIMLESGEENSFAVADVLAPGTQQHDLPGELPAPPATDLHGKPPQILLLADSIPRGRKVAGGAKDNHKAPGAERKPGSLGSLISQIKNLDITQKEPPWTDVTTVMMRNLPNKYTQAMLLEELQDSGFRAAIDFDFFYLPMDHTNAANLGYCFINFTATAMANAFAAAFQLKRMRRFNSNKTVVVMPASIQGYERNHAYYSSTRVVQAEDPQYRPLFMKGSTNGASGAPTAATKGTQGGKGGSKGAVADTGGATRAEKKSTRRKGANGNPGNEAHADAGHAAGRSPWRPWAEAPAPEPGQPCARAPMAPLAPLLSDLPLLPGTAPWPAVGPAAPPPIPTSMPAPAPVPPPSQAVCPSCGSECNASHRFCAFCGRQIDAVPAAALQSSMRADAPTFVMPPGDLQQPPPAFSMVPSPNLEMRMAEPAIHMAESATDELDIMRGRMMLLAALKEMESRETVNTLPAY